MVPVPTTATVRSDASGSKGMRVSPVAALRKVRRAVD
jgi:hypothetical protein